MKEKHPTDDNGKETYAVSIWPDWDGNMVMYPKSLATAYYGYDEFAIGLYNNETGEFYDPLMVKMMEHTDHILRCYSISTDFIRQDFLILTLEHRNMMMQ